MVPFFVAESTYEKSYRGIAKGKQVMGQGRDGAVDNYESEVLDVNENGVEHKELCVRAKAVNRVEDCRHIHKKHCENAPKILHVAEENEKCREDKTYADIEDYQTEDREHEHEECKRKGYTVDYAENEEYTEGKSEVDKRGNVA